MTYSTFIQHQSLRAQRLKLASLLSLVHRFVAISTSFILVPFLTTKMGPSRYGLWLTINSLSAWLILTDLGLSSSLVNELSEATSKNDREAESQTLAKHVLPIFVLTVTALVVFFATFPIIPWIRIVAAAGDVSSKEIKLTIFICFVSFLINVFIGTIDRIYAAAQLLYRATVWNIASCLLAFFVVITTVTPRTPLPLITVYSLGIPMLVKIANGIFLFSFERPWLRKTIQKIRSSNIKEALRLSSHKESAFFFINQIISLVMLETDYILIAHLFGSDKVALYAISLRLSMTAFGFISAYTSPLWPAIAESKNQKDYVWMHQTFRAARRKTMLVATAICLFLIVAGSSIVHWWTKGLFNPPTSLLAASGFYLITISWCQLHALLLNGIGLIKEQSKVVSITAALNLIFSFFLGRKYGISGICWGTSFSCLISCIWYAKRTHEEFAKHIMLSQKEHLPEGAFP